MNSGIGTSTVAGALALRRLGLGPALAAMAAQAALGILANHIISRESDREGSPSYHDLMRARCGKWSGWAVAAAQAVNSLGKTVVWLIILADLIVGSSGDGSGLLPELLRAAGHKQAAEGGWYLRRWPWIVLLAATAAPVVSGGSPVCWHGGRRLRLTIVEHPIAVPAWLTVQILLSLLLAAGCHAPVSFFQHSALHRQAVWGEPGGRCRRGPHGCFQHGAGRCALAASTGGCMGCD
jgi:hypothetical protein